MTRGEVLYNEFVYNFPNFKPLIKRWSKNGKNSIEIETTIGKKFVFKKTSDGIELHPV